MFTREEKQLFKLYRGRIRGVKALHALIKWLVTPYDFIESFVPKVGTIIDFGCGYGHFTNYLCLKAPGRRVIGTDISDKKLSVATKSTLSDNVSFSQGLPDDIPKGSLGGMIILDVLCYIPPEEQSSVLARAYQLLGQDGALILREGDKKPTWKYWIAIIREKCMTKVLRLTQGNKLYFRSKEEWENELRELGFSITTRRCFSGLLHPSILIVACKRTDRQDPGRSF